MSKDIRVGKQGNMETSKQGNKLTLSTYFLVNLFPCQLVSLSTCFPCQLILLWMILFVVAFLSCSQPDSKEDVHTTTQEDKWYILADKEYGPVSLQELEKWCEEGRILPNTLVRKGKESRYKIAKSFLELQQIFTKSTSQHIEPLQEEEIQEEEIPLIPNVTHGLQPKED